MMTALELAALALAAFSWLGLAQAAEGKGHGFLDRTHRDPDGQEAKYILFVPHVYRGDKPPPLILALHGAGETGKDGRRQVVVGLGPAVRQREKSFPFLVIFPQSQKRTWQANSADAQRALAILAEVEKEYKVDHRRVYLTGISMGGFGTWSLAAKYPERWAAIVPVCGGGDPKQADKIKNIPCWCFHGAADRVVSPQRSRAMMKALWAAGGHPNYTEYANVGHNSWDKAYATPDLYEWMLQFHLKNKSGAPASGGR
jgi:predicted peptidase